MSRIPTIGALEIAFCERFTETAGDLTAAIRTLRDLIVVGQERCRARAMILERRRRQGASPAPQARIAEADLRLVHSVARGAGVLPSQIVGEDRTRRASRARFEAMWVLRHVRKMSFEEIGTLVGGRDHSVAIRAVRIVDQRVKDEPKLAARLRRIGRQAA